MGTSEQFSNFKVLSVGLLTYNPFPPMESISPVYDGLKILFTSGLVWSKALETTSKYSVKSLFATRGPEVEIDPTT